MNLQDVVDYHITPDEVEKLDKKEIMKILTEAIITVITMKIVLCDDCREEMMKEWNIQRDTMIKKRKGKHDFN
tara:strand:- start:6191 stop:6409 length:219 start_codon:yes stop_codon:yes gene_type:complete